MIDFKLLTGTMKIIIIIIIIFIFFSINSFAQNKKLLIAPDFTIISTKLDTFNLYNEISKHKIVVLDFFSLYCSTCQNNTPILENIYQEYGGNGDSLWIWGIESEFGTDPEIDTFKIKYGATFPGFSSKQHNNDTILQLFDISYTPYYYIVTYDTSMKSTNINDIQSIIETYLGPPYNNKINTAFGNDFKIFSSNKRIVIDCKNNLAKSVVSLYDITGKKIYQISVSPPVQ